MEEVLACRVCLVTDVELNVFNESMQNAYEYLLGKEVAATEGLPGYICSSCAIMLMKCLNFKYKCLQSNALFKSEITPRSLITTEYIRNLNKNKSKFADVAIKQECINFNKFEDEKHTVKNFKIDLDMDMKNAVTDQDVLPKAKFEHCDVNDYNKDQDIVRAIKCEKQDYADYIDDFSNNSSDDEPLTKKIKRKKSKKEKPKRLKAEISNDEIEIVFQTKEQQLSEVHERKTTINYLNAFYKCDKCFKGFLTESTFKNHMLKHDPSSGDFVCDVCEIRWRDARSLKSHQIVSHERKYICKLCSLVSRSAHRAREHSQWHSGRRFSCTVCGASFSKSTSYLTHVRLRHAAVCCETCGHSFVSQHGLAMHRKKAHRDLKCEGAGVIYKCIDCGKCFGSSDLLEQHRSDLEDGVCRDMNSIKDKDEAKVEEEGFKCLECNRVCATEKSLSIHRHRIHLGVKKIHIKNVKRRMDIVCEVCGKKCISKAALIYHQRTHSGEKPYQCAECPKRFSVSQRLLIHMRTHTGESPFKCESCVKAFKHKAALNRHNRVHTGVKPYTCPHCSKSFSQSNSMKLHVKTVHLKMPAPYRNKRTKLPE